MRMKFYDGSLNDTVYVVKTSIFYTASQLLLIQFASKFTLFITCANEGMFRLAILCLVVRQQLHVKISDRIFMKILPEM